MSKSLVVLYGTETGVAEEASEKIVNVALVNGYTQVTWQPMDAVAVDQWVSLECETVVLVCSTTGQGDIPTSMKETWDVLRMSDAPDLEGLNFAVFGLGDSSYEKFNYTAKMLHNRLKQLGGSPVINRGLGDDLDPSGYDEALVPWVAELFSTLGGGDPEGEEGMKNEAPPAFGTAAFIKKKLTLPSKYVVTVDNITEGSTSSSSSSSLNLPRLDPYPMTVCSVKANRLLTSEDHFQEVRHLELEKKEGSALSNYQAGDALGVYPVQPVEEVKEFLARVDLLPTSLITIQPRNNNQNVATTDDVPSAHYGLISQPDQVFFDKSISGGSAKSMTALELFTHHLGVTNTGSRNLLELLAFYSTDPEVEERLLELADPTNIDEFNSFCHREKRSVVEILLDFPTVKVPLDQLIAALKPLRPRYFSIASAPSDPNIALTVAVLAFKTPYKRERRGLCSGLLADAVPGTTEFQCFILPCSMRLPCEEEEEEEEVTLRRGETKYLKDTPLVLIGPGTGIAPLRSLVRTAVGLKWQGPIHLFNGCRYKAKDYLYGDEWSHLKSKTSIAEGDANLSFFEHTAFSRDQEKKCYVNHLLVRQPTAQLLAELILLKGAKIYLCGNSKQMPIDVNTSLCSLITAFSAKLGVEGLATEDQAKRYLNRMKSAGRYQLDTWG